MKIAFRVMALPGWIIDGDRVYDSFGTPLDEKPAAALTVDAVKHQSKHGREQIAPPWMPEIITLVTGEWVQLPVKGGARTIQLLQQQNADTKNPTMQRYAFRRVQIVTSNKDVARLIKSIPTYDHTGNLVEQGAPSAA